MSSIVRERQKLTIELAGKIVEAEIRSTTDKSYALRNMSSNDLNTLATRAARLAERIAEYILD